MSLRVAVPNLCGTRNQARGRQFFPRTRGSGWFGDDSSTSYLLCIYFYYLLHQLHLKWLGIRSWRLQTLALESGPRGLLQSRPPPFLRHPSQILVVQDPLEGRRILYRWATREASVKGLGVFFLFFNKPETNVATVTRMCLGPNPAIGSDPVCLEIKTQSQLQLCNTRDKCLIQSLICKLCKRKYDRENRRQQNHCTWSVCVRIIES